MTDVDPDAQFNPDRCPECDGAGFVDWDRFTGREWPCPVCMTAEDEAEAAA